MLETGSKTEKIELPSFEELGIDKARVLRVIESLRVNGNEIHPGSVALELGIPRTYIYENLELLELIYSNMERSFGHDKLIIELIKEATRLNRKLKKSQKEITSLEKEAQQSYSEGFSKGASLNYEKAPKQSLINENKELWARALLYLDLNEELDAGLVKKAYRRMINYLHPDKTQEDSNEMVNQLQQAYNYLIGKYE